MGIKCKLNELIQDRGLKKGYVAEKAGISRAAMTNLLTGKSLPTLPVAFKLAKVLGLSIEDIWEEEE